MLIGLCGDIGSGKDTVAKILVNYHSFERLALADPIANGMVAMFGITLEEYHNRTLKELPHPKLMGKSIRDVARLIGTEFGRDMIHEDIWTFVLNGKYTDKLCSGHDKFVISDVRFENEEKWIRANGGIIVKVIRENNDYSHNMSSHRSDIYKPTHDYAIFNSGNIQDLINEVSSYLHVTSFR